MLADRAQLEQVIINLAVNARDAMPDGGTLEISTGCFGGDVLLEVSDTGQGIPDDVMPHIFEPFFTTKDQGKGTGLGLATVYGIVTRIGGRIRARNNARRGCTFSIALQLAAAPRVERGTPFTSAAQPGTENILLVEDEPSVRALAQAVLRRGGYRVLAADDGAHAVAIAADERDAIDLLVTDVVMPGMSGPDLANRLTGMLPMLKVLFMSGYVDHPRLQSGVAHALVVKRFTAAALTTAVRTALDANAVRRAS